MMNQKKSKAKLIYTLLLIFFLITFFISGFLVVRYLVESFKQGSRYDDLAALMESEAALEEATGDPQLNPEASGSDSAEGSQLKPLTVMARYRKLYEMNDHMVGWIMINGTDISYPVMQTPEEKDYYLHRNFDREPSSHGCIYVREECDLLRPSDNVVIYGHRMKDGSMFEDLVQFERKSFWEEHSEIRFDTIYEHHTYEVFAVFKTTASIGQGFEYHNFLEAATEEDFDWFVRQCKSLSLYETGITPQYGDKLISLSTCEYSQVNGRLVVVAVRTK